MPRRVTLLLCGDVMLGRGIDQVLARPGDPILHEEFMHDARGYVELVARLSGAVPHPVPDTWPWGDAVDEIERSRPGVLVVNLETAVTRDGTFAPGKAIHYRMSPENLGCLTAVRPDVCVLANNHVRDFGTEGLEETLHSLTAAGLPYAGAGRDLGEALRPAVVSPDDVATVSVLGYGHPGSGIPASWRATQDHPGVALLPDLSAETTAWVVERVAREKAGGAIVVVSLHWGSNWGYGVPDEQVRFAHQLVEAGADVVHGHSSHHPRPLEVYAGRLVLYGCGDFVNDYEGIGGHEDYRGDLRPLYRVSLAPDGALVSAELLPFRSRRLRLERAAPADVAWLASTLDRVSRRNGVRLQPTTDGRVVVDLHG